jgi:hypothetical protein
VVELSAGARARIKYSTVQNWYAGDEEGKGGIYNFVTKRGLCHGANAFISWTQACLLGARFLLVPRKVAVDVFYTRVHLLGSEQVDAARSWCLQATCHDQRRGGAVVFTCWGVRVLSCNLLFFS